MAPAGEDELDVEHDPEPDLASAADASEPDLASAADASEVDSFVREVARLETAAPLSLGAGRVGQRFGRFEIAEQIGAGGMGVVYAARDLSTGRRVALKVLPSALATDPQRARRFGAEAAALAALEHPAIVRHVAHGATPAGEPFLAMEWLEGEDLARRLRRGPLSVAEAVAVGARAAEALAAAHERGIIHRDVKPSNLFLRGGDADRAALIDFGIARLDEAALTLTASGAVMGTPGYMAPEQARGARELSPRSDLFALGAVLFECLAGRPAFVGQHAMAVLAKVLLEEPPRLADVRPDTPAALADLVARLLAKEPSERPESAAAVAAELGALSLDAAAAPSEAPARSARALSLTGSEQRFLCVIVASAAPGASEAGARATITGAAALTPLVEACARFGAELVRLLDGSLLVTLPRAGSAADQAVRAARCALALAPLLRGGSLAIATGLGDASGPVPVGQALDRAVSLVRAEGRGAPPGVRAEGRGAPPGVRIDDVTAGLLDARFVVREGPDGRQLVEERAAPSARLLLGRATPCVGRERELRALVDLLDECQGEPVARAVLVTAPAGAGKSRLLHELSNAIAGRAEPFAVWSGRGDPMSAGSAFSLVASALRGAAGVHGGEPLGARRGALAAWTARFVAERDRGRVAAFLGEILGAPFPDDGMPLLRGARESPGVMAEQVRRAFEDLVAGACAAGPLLIALEDLHWGDLPSVKLVDAALARLHDRPLFVVALARPEVHDLFPKLWVERGAQEIRLGELTRRAAERLVRHALGDAAPAETVARVVGRAAGNAFYLEELIRAVAEGRGGELPETVLAMAQARLDALGAEDRGLLRAASVFGETFWEGGVAALLGASGPASRLRERLDALADREVLVRRDESRFAGERELSFRHALLRDSAYAMLSGDDRALGHRLAGAWLEARGEGDALVLAEHFERGGEGGRAAAHYARAARQAIAGGDPACVGRAERGLACGAEGEVRWELLALLSRCCWLMGDLAGSAAAGDEVLRIAPPGSLPHAMMLPGKIMLTALAGDRQGLVDATAQACDAPLSAGIAGALAEACYGALTLSPDLPPALRDRLRERLSEIERAAPPGDRVALGYAAAARACLALHFDDDLERAAELQGAAVEHLEAAGEVGICARLRGTRAGLFALLGAFERADEEYGRALAQAGGAWMELWTIRCGRAWCFGDEARAAQAAAEATWALEHAVTPGWQGWTRQVLARALRRLGDLPAAEREVLAALQGPQAISYQRADTLATLAAIRLAQGRPAEALAAAREALSDREGFARPFQDNLLRLVLAEALLACGDSAAGDAALAAARARLLRLAGNIRDPALREAFLQRIDENRRTLALAEARLGPA